MIMSLAYIEFFVTGFPILDSICWLVFWVSAMVWDFAGDCVSRHWWICSALIIRRTRKTRSAHGIQTPPLLHPLIS
jgi:hypothetical protein